MKQESPQEWLVRGIYESTKDAPKVCPKCGSEMEPWLITFVDDGETNLVVDDWILKCDKCGEEVLPERYGQFKPCGKKKVRSGKAR